MRLFLLTFLLIACMILFGVALFAAPQSVSIDTATKQVINPIVKFGSGNTLDGTGATITGFPGSSYSFAQSLLNTAGTVSLVNDTTTPGNSKYYGTDSGGTRGYFNLPASGGNPGGSDKQFQYNNANAFGGIPSLTYDGTIPATITMGQNGAFDAKTGILLRNTNAATLGVPQASSAIEFLGNAWNSGSNTSVPMAFRFVNYPSSSSSTDANLYLEYQENGGSWTSLVNFEAPTQIVGISGDLQVSGISLANTFFASLDYSNGIKLFPDASNPNITLNVQAASTNAPTYLTVIPHGTFATSPSSLVLYGTDAVSDLTNEEHLLITSKGSSDTYHSIASFKGGTGTVRPLNINALNTLVTPQLVIGTDGGVSVGTGTAAGSTNLKVAGTITASNFPQTIVGGFTAHFSRGGAAIQANDVLVTPWTCPYSGTITGYSISADTGTCTLKTWKKANGTAIPTIADVISTSGVALSSGTHIRSSTVSDFTTTTVTAGDMFMAQVTATSGPTDITFQVEITR